jgi:hypothetical protein
VRKSFIGVFVGVVAIAMAVAGVESASAGTKGGVTFETKYTASKVKKSTGFNTSIVGAPKDSAGKLDPANKVVVTFQAGTKFDTTVPGVCPGTSAIATCSKSGSKSIVGSGQAEAISGITAIDPVKEKITAVNVKNGILFYLTGLQTVTIPSKLKKNVLTTNVPPFPVPGNPKGAVLTKFTLKIPPKTKSGKNYVTSPSKCSGKKWTVKGDFFYPNVPAIKGIASVSKCS